MYTTEQLNAMTPAEALKAIIAMQAENEALKNEIEARKAGSVTKIQNTRKGGVSVYGLQRFPITLYPSQWTTLLNASPRIQKHLTDNAADLEATAAAWKSYTPEERAKIEAENTPEAKKAKAKADTTPALAL